MKTRFSIFLLAIIAACSDGGTTEAEPPFASPEQVAAVTVGIDDARARIISGLERPDRATIASEFEGLAKRLRTQDRAGTQRHIGSLTRLLGAYGDGGPDATDLDVLRLTVAAAASLVGVRPAASLLPPGSV